MENKKLSYIFISFVMGSIVTLLASSLAYKAENYVYVDVEKIISHILPVISKNAPSLEESKVKIDKAKDIFKKEIDNYAKSNHAIVLNQMGIIAGAKDITKDIEDTIFQELGEKR